MERKFCKKWAVVGEVLVICLLLGGQARGQVAITVDPTLPSDIPGPGGAVGATLQQAAAFAWQEFIAANWPAMAGQRDVPDTHQKFGASSSDPLVWQTYRSKVEIFDLATGTSAPPGYSPNPPDYGYNTPPASYYYGALNSASYQVLPCPGQTAPASPAWINLDETTQIGLDQMFAGGPTINNTASSAPQLIRFTVKANKTEYDYIAANQYYLHDSRYTTAAANNVAAYTANPPVAPTSPYIAFPTGTIEIKSAWRPLNTNDDPAHFRVQTVRFYENKGPNSATCYLEEKWGLIALHIIHKTPTAPAFIYATFEQTDNIRQPEGKPVEDAEGRVTNAIPRAGPTTPPLIYQDSNLPPGPEVIATEPFCKPRNNLYFEEIPGNTGLPVDGAICINQRYEPIQRDVIKENEVAHDAIRDYDRTQHVHHSPWRYYKLVSVQPLPFDVSAISPTDPVHGAAVFFQANIVVETDYTLQQFRGRIDRNKTAPDTGAGAPSSIAKVGYPPPNVVTPALTGGVTGVNMGGCMGCHGNAQVSAGSDFSFILAEGPDPYPEIPAASMSDPAVRAKYMDQLRARYMGPFFPLHSGSWRSSNN